MASTGKGPAEVAGSAAEGKGSVAWQANAGENPADKPLEAAKAADAVRSAVKAVGATTDPAAEAERPMDARHGERTAMNAGQGRPDGGKSETAAMEAVRTRAQDGASREAAKTAVAPLANMADAGRKVGEKGQPQQISADKPQEGDAVTRASAPSAQSGGERKSHDARDGFFGARGEDTKASARPASTSGKIVLETEAQFQGAGQNTQANVAQRLEMPVSARSAEVYRQVEGGAFRNLGQGVKQLVIRLDPADLGQVSVILRVKGKEIQAVLRASSQETSQILGEQVAQLRSQLEAQGLKVGKLEVQTQLADSQSQSQWQGAEQHNRYQENRELAMSAQRWRTMERMDSGLVRDVQNTPQREKLSSGGLDIFA
jgi:flagellar hook-length control protein FliK